METFIFLSTQKAPHCTLSSLKRGEHCSGHRGYLASTVSCRAWQVLSLTSPAWSLLARFFPLCSGRRGMLGQCFSLLILASAGLAVSLVCKAFLCTPHAFSQAAEESHGQCCVLLSLASAESRCVSHLLNPSLRAFPRSVQAAEESLASAEAQLAAMVKASREGALANEDQLAAMQQVRRRGWCMSTCVW
eukprot:1159989-Pelagomonas_calceolata.AAC.6